MLHSIPLCLLFLIICDIVAPFTIMWPGTKWCGKGNIADGPDDLGELTGTDACCRDHDLCPDKIKAHQTKHNLTNDKYTFPCGTYSKMNCECDVQFYECLKEEKPTPFDTHVSNQIGRLFFNICQPECFEFNAYTMKWEWKTEESFS